MAVQSRTNNTNLAFVSQGLPISIVREAESVKQDAARTTPLVAGTVMAQLASTRKWIPLSNTAENSAEESTTTGPFVMAPGDTMVIDVDNAGNATATFDAAAGYKIDTTTYAVSDQDGKTLKLSIDGGATQTITFSGSTTTAASIINQINAGLVGGYAVASTTHVKIVSDKKGTGSSVAVVAGGTTDMTWNASVGGTGDVADILAVTAAEIKTVVEADTTANVTVVGQVATISSPTTGEGSELQFVSGNVLAAVGISAGVVVPTSTDGGCHPAGFLMEDIAAADLVAGNVSAPVLAGCAIVDENQVVFEGSVTKNTVVAVSGLNKTVEAILGWNNLYLEATTNVDEFEN